ncbi:phospholipase A and acyltransferase 1-like [Mytilus californianus]|uniref:phospholipase A and acyltransferase 1-like n=1 Tax=Mytilus californianus TaxID=6549 RepID=UPI0022479826|nr:phospholipase A and acyltransferase 1-like [Mytilus californianus]
MAQKTLPNPIKTLVEEGDLLEIDRGAYCHWAVYIGNNEVVHVAGIDGPIASDLSHSFSVSGVLFNKAEVKRENVFDVFGNSKCTINNSKDGGNQFVCKLRNQVKEVVKRALGMIGPLKYNVLWSNCEHFASWCRNGEAISKQADNVLTVGMVIGGLLNNVIGSDKSSKR